MLRHLIIKRGCVVHNNKVEHVFLAYIHGESVFEVDAFYAFLLAPAPSNSDSNSRNQVRQGIRIARKLVAPDLLLLEIPAPEVAK